jgi:hypothetical protein
MKKSLSWILIAGFAAAVVGMYFIFRKPAEEPVQPPPIATQSVQPAQQGAPSAAPVRYPVPKAEPTALPSDAPPSARLLPALDTSDRTIVQELERVFGRERIEELLNLKDFLRRVVTTVETLTAKMVSAEGNAFKRVPGSFLVAGQEDALTIDSKNYERYAPYVALAETAASKSAIAVYVRFYPLLQQAYRDLGTQNYFNDRVVDVLDTLLKTPEAQEPVPVVKIGKSFKYQDQTLEGLTAGQKILIRMGSENAGRVKKALQRIRASVTRLSSD